MFLPLLYACSFLQLSPNRQVPLKKYLQITILMNKCVKNKQHASKSLTIEINKIEVKNFSFRMSDIKTCLESMC